MVTLLLSALRQSAEQYCINVTNYPFCFSLIYPFSLFQQNKTDRSSTIKGWTVTDLELPLILYVFTTLCVGWMNSILRSPLLPHLSVIVSSYWIRARIFPFFFFSFFSPFPACTRCVFWIASMEIEGRRMKRNWKIPSIYKILLWLDVCSGCWSGDWIPCDTQTEHTVDHRL